MIGININPCRTCQHYRFWGDKCVARGIAAPATNFTYVSISPASAVRQPGMPCGPMGDMWVKGLPWYVRLWAGIVVATRQRPSVPPRPFIRGRRQDNGPTVPRPAVVPAPQHPVMGRLTVEQSKCPACFGRGGKVVGQREGVNYLTGPGWVRCEICRGRGHV